MIRLRPVRFTAGWILVGGVLSVLGYGIEKWADQSGVANAIHEGIWITALADVVIYVLLAIGLLAVPERFLLWWGIASLFKLGWFGGVIGVAILARERHLDAFLLAVGAAFLVFSAHHVVLLVPFSVEVHRQERLVAGSSTGGGEHVRTRER